MLLVVLPARIYCEVFIFHSILLIFLPGAFAFIVLREQAADIDHVKEELKTIVATKIAKYAVPDHILVSGRLTGTVTGII